MILFQLSTFLLVQGLLVDPHPPIGDLSELHIYQHITIEGQLGQTSRKRFNDHFLLSRLEGEAASSRQFLFCDRCQQDLFSFSSALIASAENSAPTTKSEQDLVIRVLDANTVKLKKKGIVRLAGVRMPNPSSSGGNTSFQFPDCFSYNPSYKLRQLLPVSTPVEIQTIRGPSNNQPAQVVLVRSEDTLIVNRELVKTGFAKVLKQTSSSNILDVDELLADQEEAKTQGLGIFTRCDADNDTKNSKIPVVQAEFEPLERTIETVYTVDGGKQQVRSQDSKGKNVKPGNPGDIKGCSDFSTYEDALRWFETYEPYYGDVAKLDRDGDGVPCPGLPHTSNRERYRMKIPKRR